MIPTRTRTRTSAAALLLLLVAWSPAPARAFQITLVKLTEAETNATVQEYFFNQARCECETELLLTIEWDLEPDPHQDITVRAGTSCLNTDVNSLKDTCEVLYQQSPLDEIRSNIKVSVTAKQLMGTDCSGQNQQSRYIFVYVNTPEDVDVWQEVFNYPFTADTKPPRNPTAKELLPGEDQVTVSYGASGGTTTSDAGTATQESDIKGYQVLCQKVIEGDGGATRLEPGKSSPPDPAYMAAVNLCDAPCSAGEAPSPDAGVLDGGSTADLGPQDGGVADAPATTTDSAVSGVSLGIECLEEQFVCSGISASTATSLTVEDLVNDQLYRFYVVAVDRYDNPSEPVLIGQAAPALQEDLAERYERSGGQAQGEDYCFVATAAYGSLNHPQVRILRQFRDRVLLRGAWGQRLVATYYRHSPGPAAWLARHDSIRPLARAALWPLTLGASAWIYTSGGQKLLGLGLGLLLISGLLWRRRRPLKGAAR